MLRRLSSASLVSVLALVLLPGAPASARAVPVDQFYPVPASGVLTLRGHGYGHGHGMSQYGAYGAARRGLTYRQIVRFYYPGTSWGTARRWLRVLITADTTSDLVVSTAPGLRVRDLGSGRSYPLPAVPGATRWRLAASGGRTVVSYRTSRWHRYRPGGRAALVGDGQFSATRPLRLWTPGGSRTYRGVLRSVTPRAGSSVRDTVNVVAPDAYVRGVVPTEMPTSWSIAAVQAQSVAARTYADWSRNEDPRSDWHLCDTSACQVYGGVEAETARGNRAVRRTAGRILTYRGAPAFTQFSASSGGRLSAGNRPYLVDKADPYDDHDANPVHDWTVQLTARRIQRAYPGIGRLVRLHVTSREGAGQWRGRVVRIVLDGRRRNVTLSGDEFRSAFGLRSTWFRA